jgi:hypothetical protein
LYYIEGILFPGNGSYHIFPAACGTIHIEIPAYSPPLPDLTFSSARNMPPCDNLSESDFACIHLNVKQVSAGSSVAVLPGLFFSFCCKTERFCCSNTTFAALLITMPLLLIQTGLIMTGLLQKYSLSILTLVAG